MSVALDGKTRAVDFLTAADVPEGESGAVAIRRFEVDEEAASWMRLRYAVSGHATLMRPGTYTGLYRRGELWMSDTPDERDDHSGIVWEAHWAHATRVLINGLGLGMVVNAMLRIPTMQHIDVVEIDPDVIALVKPHYDRVAAECGVELAIHEADAYTIQWPKGTWWDVAWHDIWLAIDTGNLPEMARLHRKYGRRVRSQGSWRKGYLQMMRERERRAGW